MSPDTRQHRGAHPADKQLFDSSNLQTLRVATNELSWLLSRGYAKESSLKLVGDRHNLAARQRVAVNRAACSDRELELRLQQHVPVSSLKGKELAIDGFNLIISVEAAMGGGAMLVGRDGCIRDLSGVHGSYRSVEETESAIRLIGSVLSELEPLAVHWFLDKPVSNSGRLAALLRTISEGAGWNWTVELVFSPDASIALSAQIAVTTDSIVLERSSAWSNFGEHLLRKYLPQSWIVDLSVHSCDTAV